MIQPETNLANEYPSLGYIKEEKRRNTGNNSTGDRNDFDSRSILLSYRLGSIKTGETAKATKKEVATSATITLAGS